MAYQRNIKYPAKSQLNHSVPVVVQSFTTKIRDKKMIVEKRWGNFEQFILNETATVKILNIKAGKRISLQRHFQRDEYWKILSGYGQIQIGDIVYKATPDMEFTIPVEELHQVTATEDMKILEISTGYFDEEDIERLSL